MLAATARQGEEPSAARPCKHVLAVGLLLQANRAVCPQTELNHGFTLVLARTASTHTWEAGVLGSVLRDPRHFMHNLLVCGHVKLATDAAK
jgi:hypothetical protein